MDTQGVTDSWYSKIWTKRRHHKTKPRRSNSGSQSPEPDYCDNVDLLQRKASRNLQRLTSSSSLTTGFRVSVAMSNLTSLDEEKRADNFGMTGEWRTAHEVTDLELEARLGDRLEFRRSQFADYGHWGIYVGRRVDQRCDHQVIHFGIFQKGAQFCKKKLCGFGYFASRRPEILVSSIEEILGADTVRINNARDNSWPPLDTDDIVGEAVRQLETQANSPLVYHVVRNNCEHFVNICRYDRRTSDQAEDYVRSIPLVKRFVCTKPLYYKR